MELVRQMNVMQKHSSCHLFCCVRPFVSVNVVKDQDDSSGREFEWIYIVQSICSIKLADVAGRTPGFVFVVYVLCTQAVEFYVGPLKRTTDNCYAYSSTHFSVYIIE